VYHSQHYLQLPLKRRVHIQVVAVFLFQLDNIVSQLSELTPQSLDLVLVPLDFIFDLSLELANNQGLDIFLIFLVDLLDPCLNLADISII
jgi:hypothetical protein